jgi:hypothetical protein
MHTRERVRTQKYLLDATRGSCTISQSVCVFALPGTSVSELRSAAAAHYHRRGAAVFNDGHGTNLPMGGV